MKGAVSLLGSLAVLGFVSSQGYYEERRHLAHEPSLSTIPKQFEIRDFPQSNPAKEFEKYAEQIHHIARKDNISVVYKIQVETLKRFNTKISVKKYNKQKLKAKKYNIPLKKNSMKLSNFEVFLRKAAEENYHYPPPGGLINYHMTSTEVPQLTTKIPHLKFKPIKSKLRNFSKVIRPVRNNIITLS